MQLLPPAQVTSLFTPVSSVHWLVPVQLEVQFDVQLPTQVERPSQVFVQPVPHVRSHWLFELQLYVTSSGSGAAAAPPLSLLPPSSAVAAGPKVQVPPALQVHVVSVQAQSPVQVGSVGLDLDPPQLRPTASASRMMLVVMRMARPELCMGLSPHLPVASRTPSG